MAHDGGRVAVARGAAFRTRSDRDDVARPRSGVVRLRRRRPPTPVRADGGVVLDGHGGLGDGREIPDGRVVVDPGGRVAAVGPAQDVAAPADAELISASWVGPGLYDAHVHLAFGRAENIVPRGVVRV